MDFSLDEELSWINLKRLKDGFVSYRHTAFHFQLTHTGSNNLFL